MVKKQIRQEYIKKRSLLTYSEIADMDDRMFNNFRTIDLQGVQQLLSYCSVGERKEFNTKICEQWLMLENPGIKIAFPKLRGYNDAMDAVEVNSESILIKNRFDIPEPVENKIVDPQLIDAIFVPLLAFDTRGFRVGYGKGFYDRYLAACAQDVVKIGFSYFEALDIIEDINEFDVPLNYCITPMRVYEF